MKVERDRRFSRLPIEPVREDDVGTPGRLALPQPRVPPELPLLGDQEAVASVSPLALVVDDALEGRGEETLELVSELRQGPTRALSRPILIADRGPTRGRDRKGARHAARRVARPKDCRLAATEKSA